jgi:hypothetical protein
MSAATSSMESDPSTPSAYANRRNPSRGSRERFRVALREGVLEHRHLQVVTLRRRHLHEPTQRPAREVHGPCACEVKLRDLGGIVGQREAETMNSR